jgi:DNA-binding NarL/FixJ family response regulator
VPSCPPRAALTKGLTMKTTQEPLSHDDLALLRLLAQGLPLGAVARRMRTSDRTVRRRAKGICDRLGVTAPIEAVVWAAKRGLL